MPGKRRPTKRRGSKGVPVALTEQQLRQLDEVFRGTELTTVVPDQPMGILKQALVTRRPPGRPRKPAKPRR